MIANQPSDSYPRPAKHTAPPPLPLIPSCVCQTRAQSIGISTVVYQTVSAFPLSRSVCMWPSLI